MIVIHRFLTGPESCVYLPDQLSRTEHELIVHLTPEEYEARMNAGWRKFGPVLFHPICSACAECRPIRIRIADFQPDRCQMRTLKRNADLTVRFAKPTVDAQRLALYNRYHAAQEARKGWPETEKSTEDYFQSFLLNPIPAVEISAWEGETLRAIALTDITPHVVSGVYHYHDPDCRNRSLGTFVMLHVLALAQRLEKPYAYFGYYVADCASMNYKARFRPCELLDTEGVWRPLEEEA
ncbi:MAG TPA: arginyltransferase [Chthonomonadaceae bacterium]|nr:arginyltransferase [Chthonomonadaceae bacterium]